ncbi:hypothetical protein CD351_00740 [Erythrobacter sp. KY5]|uniref:DUF4198 domain-containing protein n=1 Tax=Erythrobacter sp. KY5 TaxID=2011159 RepID=UPI000DBF03CD|nr:DUF4198 domain-containing protein [Erythrobacter sp. KY5]AWW72946.1 hypothetical protein CD351_00740 [Erythrobacter sp. KY5]
MIRTVLTALALVASTGAAAHSFWLQPEDHTPAAGEEVLIEFKVGDAGDVKDWGLYWERIASLRLYSPDGVVDQQRAVRTTAADEVGSAVVSIRGEGTHILAFESNPSFSDLEAERFNRYVDHEGLRGIAADRILRGTTDENGTELYARRAKTLLQVGERHTRNATRAIGHVLEIVPLQNPFSLEPGEPLDLQVFFRGEPLEGAMLSAVPLGVTAKYQTFLTSADGVVRVAAPGENPTLYSVVWGVPAPNDARAEYFTIFASLTVASE